nr:TetR/AcrR family transcriptional regulator [Leucobacter edaphi]
MRQRSEARAPGPQRLGAERVKQHGARNSERTRRSLLDAATMLLSERGMTVSLETIATAAGVTRAGLLHHFPNREELIRAVAEDTVARFREAVDANFDPAEQRPGGLLRAYIRTLFASERPPIEIDYPGLWHALATSPGVDEFLIADAQRWREAFAVDGLHEDRILVVMNAAEGVVAAAQWDTGISAAMVSRARQVLLSLTEGDGPLALAAA